VASLALTAFLPLNAIGEEESGYVTKEYQQKGTLRIGYSTTGTLRLGEMGKGSTIKYHWNTDNPEEIFDFYITDDKETGGKQYQKVEIVNAGKNTFEVPEDGEYWAKWVSKNEVDPYASDLNADVTHVFNMTIIWPDSDNDGVKDSLDAFPEDPDEQYDFDGDGVGDNADKYPNDPERSEDKKEDSVGFEMAMVLLGLVLVALISRKRN